MTNAFVELGAASTDSALDSDLADTDLHDSANEAARGIPVMAYSMADALQLAYSMVHWPITWPMAQNVAYYL